MSGHACVKYFGSLMIFLELIDISMLNLTMNDA